MSEQGISRLQQLAVVSPDEKELRTLLETVPEQYRLSSLDLLTLRDLLDHFQTRETAVAALLVCLFHALHGGSLCLDLEPQQLQQALAAAFPDAAGKLAPAKLAAAALAWLDKAGSDVVDKGKGAFVPLVLAEQSGGRFLYFQKWHQAGTVLYGRLQQLIRKPETKQPLVPIPQLQQVLEEVLVSKPGRSRDGTALVLNPLQQAAVALGLVQPFLVISGGPGTGKTSIVAALVRCLMHRGTAPDRIALTAPTGRAARRLQDALATTLASLEQPDNADQALSLVEGKTLHRLLGYSPARGRFMYGAHCRLPVDVVIVDEVSMVDTALMARLLAATEENTRLILLGDKNQLPSVEAGTVLADLLPPNQASGCDHAAMKLANQLLPDLKLAGPDIQTDTPRHAVVLARSYRSVAEIMDLARAINRGNPDCSERLVSGQHLQRERPPCQILPPLAAEEKAVREQRHTLLRAWAQEWLAHHPLQGKPGLQELLDKAQGLAHDDPALHKLLPGLLAALHSHRILCLIKGGPMGTRAANRFLRKEMQGTARASIAFHGSPLLITSNDYTRSLFNGDTGLLLEGPEGSFHALFAGSEGPVLHPLELLPAHEQAFAITVHKSQGSEYENVLLMLPEDNEHPMLTREMVYTAVTRARSRLVIHGTGEALALAATRASQRISGFRLWE